MSQATETAMLSKLTDCFLFCKTVFKKVIRNQWTVLFDLELFSTSVPQKQSWKKYCAPARFPDKIITGVHYALVSMPCKVWKGRSDNTGLTSFLLPIWTHFYWYYSCPSGHTCNKTHKIIWGSANLFDLTYVNYYVKTDSLLCISLSS